MYDQYPKVLLDLDVDFMLSDTYSWCDPSRLKLDVTGHQYGKVVKQLLKPKTKVHLVIDHHEALYHWDQAQVKGALCIHVDAHHDMWNNPGVNKPKTRNRIALDCGCYLQQAMIDHVVDRTIYVPSLFRGVNEQRQDIENNYYRGCERVSVHSWNKFKTNINKMPKADIVTVAISPDFFPKRYWGQVENLCKQLGVKPWTIKTMKSKAYSCWRQIDRNGAHNEYGFPYKGTAVMELVS
jgi:hypothetical protein